MAYQVGSAETMTAEPQRRARGLGAETKHLVNFSTLVHSLLAAMCLTLNHIQHRNISSHRSTRPSCRAYPLFTISVRTTAAALVLSTCSDHQSR